MKPWNNGPEPPHEPYPIQRDPGDVPPDQQYEDIARPIIHTEAAATAKINSKLSHYNSAFYSSNRIIGEIGE
ncbi:TVG0703225 [Thermoplasma volcanium GSS1]|uniref:TVG0703225 protein n=1 Tax=Thermoplasma volcanium (strain ATCC 51530 / DSM 4299 / JCM 9571 / NBRC 15438 / GSS1) TaxID=273116 RepID=Q97AW2_THEVO|nr:hypothetical protein [Thermoplasma volcanium]BAB59839.1 TVG0703225 [Thermoplasma volcanium GSS1]